MNNDREMTGRKRGERKAGPEAPKSKGGDNPTRRGYQVGTFRKVMRGDTGRGGIAPGSWWRKGKGGIERGKKKKRLRRKRERL